MPITTVTSKGQVTIPKEIRERAGVSEGDRLDFRIDERGRIVVEPVGEERPIPAAGSLRAYAPAAPVSVDEMAEAVAEGAVKREGRTRRARKK